MTKKYILYVEDDKFQSKLYSGIIQRVMDTIDMGYKVLATNSGDEALKLIKNQKSNLKVKIDDIGIILYDLLIPDVSGLQFLKEAKEIGIKTPIAILTAEESPDIKKKAENLGAVGYFIKGSPKKSELEELCDLIYDSMKN